MRPQRTLCNKHNLGCRVFSSATQPVYWAHYFLNIVFYVLPGKEAVLPSREVRRIAALCLMQTDPGEGAFTRPAVLRIEAPSRPES